MFKRVRTGNHQGLSDHNPKLAYLNEGFKKRWKEKTKNIRKTPRRSNIAWEKLCNKDKRDDFKVKTGNIEIQQTGNVFKDWKKVEKGVVRTAEQVCGIKKRKTNDWLTSHMEELQKLLEERKEASRVRNEQKRLYNLNQSMRNEQAFNYAVEHFKTVKNRHLRCLRAWENQCRKAQLKGNIGHMYSILGRLQLRGTNQNNSKSSPLYSEEEFKEHLEAIQKDRFENSEEEMVEAVKKCVRPQDNEILEGRLPSSHVTRPMLKSNSL